MKLGYVNQIHGWCCGCMQQGCDRLFLLMHRLFQLALKMAQVRADQAIHVGDNFVGTNIVDPLEVHIFEQRNSTTRLQELLE